MGLATRGCARRCLLIEHLQPLPSFFSNVYTYYREEIISASLVFLTGTIVGAIVGANAGDFTSSNAGSFGTSTANISFWNIFSTNLVVLAILAAGGLASLGLISIIMISYNGIQLGAVFYAIVAYHPSLVVLLLPHAFVEIPALVIAAAVGIKPLLTAYAFLRGDPKALEEYVSRESIFKTIKLSSASVLLVTLSAVIESYVTGGVLIH